MKRMALIIGNSRKINLASSILTVRTNVHRTTESKQRREKIVATFIFKHIRAFQMLPVARKNKCENISKFIRILTSSNYEFHRFDDSLRFIPLFRRSHFISHFKFLTSNGNQIIPIMPFGCVSFEFRIITLKKKQQIFIQFSDVIQLMNVTSLGSSATQFRSDLAFLVENIIKK